MKDQPAGRKPLDFSIGHAPEKGFQGARSADGLTEYHYNKTILAPAIKQAFEPSPFAPRFWDAGEHKEWRRRKKGNLLLLDRLISIFKGPTGPPGIAIALHCNAAKNRRYGGFMAIYRREKDGREDKKSRRLAELLCDELGRGLPIKNRGAQPDQDAPGFKDSWVGRNLAFPRWAFRYGTAGVILEAGFLTCPKDVETLRSELGPLAIGQAIRRAVEAFEKEQAKPKEGAKE